MSSTNRIHAEIALYADEEREALDHEPAHPEAICCDEPPVDVGTALVDGKGFFLPSPLLFDPGQRLRVALRFPVHGFGFDVTSEVTHVELEESTRGPGMNFAFRDLGDDARAWLSRVLNPPGPEGI